MRVAIVGSRDKVFASLMYRLIVEYVNGLPEGTEVLSGGASGVDTIAEEAAATRGLKVVSFKPDYPKYGRRAPLERNRDIVKMADRVVAFWDEASRGTAYTLDLARKSGKPVEIYGWDSIFGKEVK